MPDGKSFTGKADEFVAGRGVATRSCQPLSNRIAARRSRVSFIGLNPWYSPPAMGGDIMFGQKRDYFGLYWPFVIGIICFLVALFPESFFGRAGHIPFTFELLKFLRLEHGLEVGFARLLITLVGLFFFFGIPSFRDYSGFFPDRMKVHALYDNEGIERFLKSISARDFRRLRTAPEWQPKKKAYFENLNKELREQEQNFRFSESYGRTVSDGVLLFRVRSLGWGAQKYQIEEAKVWFEHETEISGDEHPKTLQTEAEIDPVHAQLTGSIKDVFLSGGLLITPEFKQKFRLSPSSEATFHHSLVCATRVDIFPYPNLSETLYLKRLSDGKLVPIGYAHYSS